MAQDTTTTLLTISVLGTTRVYVVLLAGFLASKWPRHEPLLNKKACRFISRICAQLFLPALVISGTGAALNPAALRDSWLLVVAAGLTIALSFFLSGILGRLLLQPEDRRAFRPVQLAVAFPNCVGFPLLIMESLCEQDDINRDFGGDAAECFSQATGMLFTYFAVWQICFYGWGFYAIGNDDTLELKLTGQPTSEDAHAPSSASSENFHGIARDLSSNRMDSTLHRMNSMAAVDVQFGNILTTPVSAPDPGRVATESETVHGGRDGDRGAELVQMEAGAVGEPSRLQEVTVVLPLAVETVPACVVQSLKGFANRLRRSERGNSTTMSASDAVDDDAGDSCWERVHHRIYVVLMSPNIISVAVGISIAMISHLQEHLFHNAQSVVRPLGAALETMGTPTVAVMTLVMAGSLVQTSTVTAGVTQEGGSSGGVQWNMRRFRLIAAALHILCRLMLVPAAGFGVFWLATTYSTVMGENRLMHFIMLIELAMPSAALVIVSLNQLEMPATAGFMARLYLSQYGASMFTITLWTALAVHMVY